MYFSFHSIFKAARSCGKLQLQRLLYHHQYAIWLIGQWKSNHVMTTVLLCHHRVGFSAYGWLRCFRFLSLINKKQEVCDLVWNFLLICWSAVLSSDVEIKLCWSISANCVETRLISWGFRCSQYTAGIDELRNDLDITLLSPSLSFSGTLLFCCSGRRWDMVQSMSRSMLTWW